MRVLCFFMQLVSESGKNCTFASRMAEQSGGVERENGGALRLLAV